VVLGRRASPARARKPRGGPPPGASSLHTIGAATGRYDERITVRPPWPGRQDAGVGSEVRLGRDELGDLRGVLADDPIRAAQALPGVATGDDYRSEFSVRGSPYRHVGVVVDGVATPWLVHSAYGRGEGASVAMLGSDLIEEARLQTGAYPHRYGDKLGAQLGLTLREGSRDGAAFRGTISGVNAAFLGEGPIGRSERGSWLFNIRQSYRDWPIRKLDASGGTVFGFRDAQAKLVYDVRANQQLSVSLLGGVSALDQTDPGGPDTFYDGANKTAVLNLGWRSTTRSGTVITQRAYVVAHQFLNNNGTEGRADRGSDGEISYRADVTRAMFGGVFEAGGQAQRLRTSRHFSSGDAEAPGLFESFDGSSWLRSGYAHFTWNPAPRLTLAHGLRVSDSTLVHRRAVGRWLLGEWAFRPGWVLNASAGVSHQLPEFQQVLGPAGAPDLRPERAAHFDVGVERRFAQSVRLQATIFQRDERDVVREPDTHMRLVDDVLIQPSSAERNANVLRGSSRGVELLLERRHQGGVSGWLAYSYGKTRYADPARNEIFWGDFDQRHAVNAYAAYSVSASTQIGVKFRAGSNFPVPGYLTATADGLFAGSARNQVRLPPYARLDLRANRTFNARGRQITLFVEVLNVLNRANLGLANGHINPRTGQADGFTRSLFPRLPSAGLVVRF
jgi:hypothetical protein